MNATAEIKSAGPLYEVWQTSDKLFESSPLTDGFTYMGGGFQVNVFSLPSKSFIKSFTSLPEFFAENADVMPDKSLDGYCEMLNYFLHGWSCSVIRDVEKFTSECTEYDVSSVHSPYFGKDEVVFFAARGTEGPRCIVAQKPFDVAGLRISVSYLPRAKVYPDSMKP